MNNDPSKNKGIKEENTKTISRRDVLKLIGNGMVAGVVLMSGGDILIRSGKALAHGTTGTTGTTGTQNGAEGEPILVSVDTSSPGPRIPIDFTGLGFERGPLNPGNNGVDGYLFNPSNTQLITLFQNVGIKHLRIGGGSIDTMSLPGTGPDGYTGIDNLFAFAQAAGVSVLYSLRMLNPGGTTIPNLMTEDATIAQYIWQNYQHYVSSFSIGNEPDWHSYHTYAKHPNDPLIYENVSGVPGSAFPSYLADWQSFADAIRQLVPEATFSGPDTGEYKTSTYSPDPVTGVSWTEVFAKNEVGSGMIADITQHLYVGGSPGTTTAQQAVNNMLSSEWVNNTKFGTQPAGTGTAVTTYTPYPWIYTHNMAPVLQAGLHYRLTESNDYVTGVPGASNAFASALWVLDYMHWWASHQAAGVNFHNKQWLVTDTIVRDSYGNYQVNPKGYGIKAFNLGANGCVIPIDISNPNALNLTAYAVGEGHNLYVTIINKTQGGGATDASVTIIPSGFTAKEAQSIVLSGGQPGDASAMSAMLGGASITNSEPWSGKWTKLDVDVRGKVTLTVPATTAAVVRIHG
ncbi:MAG: hypothetical protein JWN30_840 [Bacilli bacterium]|nr:hypothetical protein [Bacilli bacterium]